MPYLSVPEAAELAGVTPVSIYQNIKRGKLPAVTEQIGRKSTHKIPVDGFLRWLEYEATTYERKASFLRASAKRLAAMAR